MVYRAWEFFFNFLKKGSRVFREKSHIVESTIIFPESTHSVYYTLEFERDGLAEEHCEKRSNKSANLALPNSCWTIFLNWKFQWKAIESSRRDQNAIMKMLISFKLIVWTKKKSQCFFFESKVSTKRTRSTPGNFSLKFSDSDFQSI